MSSLGKSINSCATVTQRKETCRITFPYKCENFSAINEDGRCHTLQSGDVPNVNMPQWSVSVKIAADGDYLYLSFRPDSPSPKVTLMNFKVFAVNKKKEKMQTYNKEGVITATINYCLYDYNSKIVKSLFMSEENGFLTEDALSLVFELDYVGAIDANEVQSANYLKNGFTNLFDTKQCSDVTLIVGDSTLKAHKAILIASSPVFAAMFEHDMAEQKLSSISITDIGFDVLEEMLRFIYTGKVSNLEAMAEHLLMAADKYDLSYLKLKCEESLLANISIENAVSTLVLADQYNAENLKKSALEYITAQASKVMETQDWKEIIESGSNVQLLVEAFRALAVKYT